MLAEVVVTSDGLSAEVAHEAAAPARHSVASLRLDQACPTLDALSHPSCCHTLLAAARGTCLKTMEGTINKEKERRHKSQRERKQYCRNVSVSVAADNHI